MKLDDVQLDYDALFRIPGAQFVYPYESVYRSSGDASKGKQRGRLMGPWAAKVARWYADEGFGWADEMHAFPDELGVELEFMSLLCRKRAAAMDAGDVPGASRLGAAQATFFHEHLWPWAKACARNLADRASSSFYIFVGHALSRLLDREKDALGQADLGRQASQMAS